MNTLVDLFQTIALPDGNDYVLSTKRGRERHNADWLRFTELADQFIKDYIITSMHDSRISKDKTLKKMYRHAETCYKLGRATIEAWEGSERIRKSSEYKPSEFIKVLITGKDPKHAKAIKDLDAISMSTSRMRATYYKLLRERELLDVEIAASSSLI